MSRENVEIVGGVGDGSGTRVEIELTTPYELRDGRIARVHQYDTLEEALEATGLSEMSQTNVGFVAGIFGVAEGMDKQAMVAALPDLMPELCDAEVEWIREFYDHEAALEAAGMSES